MRLKVAVLEDDAEFRDAILVPQLAAQGFEVEGFAGAADLYRRMLAVTFDLLVLDLRLGDGYGLDVARYLRQHTSIGIVTLTGQGTRAEQVIGLSEAVDAWLLKPVDIDVLAATLRSVARRLPPASPRREDEQAAMHWQLSDDGWHLLAPDRRSVPLNLQERSMLACLFANAGHLVAHRDILDAIEVVADNFDRHRLEILIHRLRRKVAGELGLSLPLRSVRGAGYVMVATDERSLED